MFFRKEEMACLGRIREHVTYEDTSATVSYLLLHSFRERSKITAKYFHELNISQHEYLTALKYKINSSIFVQSCISLACHQVHTQKPQQALDALYQIARKASCHWGTDGQHEPTARAEESDAAFYCHPPL